MAINSKVTLGWNGREYKVKMTMDVIGQVEDLGFHAINRQIAAGNMPFIRISKIVSFLLCEAGADASVDSVYAAIYGQGDTSPDDIAAMLSVITLGIAPEPKKKPITRSRKPAIYKDTLPQGRLC